jgi:uncharacterized protein YndB with AHSA1/START domain
MNTSGKEVMITRTIRHPREVVFNAWTNPTELKRWFAPRNCTIYFKKIDIRAGGEFHWCVRNPKYPDCWCIGEFLEIVFPERITYRIQLADENGNPVEPAQVFKNQDWPKETIVTVSFSDQYGYTELKIHQTVPESIATQTGAYQSWIEMVDILEETLISSTTIVNN